MDVIERIFQREGSIILHVMIDLLFSPLMQLNIIIYGLVRKCVKLSPRILLDSINIKFGSKFIDKL